MTEQPHQEMGLRRVIAATAIFAGWLTFPVGAVAGLVASEAFGINHTEGPLAPTEVYGLNGLLMMWALVVAAIVTSMPLLMAMFAPNPRRNLFIIAGAMGIPAIAVLPSELGRAFGLPVLAGAASLVFAARLFDSEPPAAPKSGEGEGDDAALGGAPVPVWPASAAPPRDAAPTPAPAPAAAEVAAPAAAEVAAPPRRGTRKKPKTSSTCQWCSADLPVGETTCPSCGATLDSGRTADALPIPGLTEVSSGLRDYQVRSARKKTSILSIVFSDDMPVLTTVPEPSDQAAVLPPSAELRAEMARLDVEIATGEAIFGAAETPTETPAETAARTAAETPAESKPRTRTKPKPKA